MITAKMWEKVLYNSALNPLGALFDVPYGRLGKNPETYEFMRNILKEIFSILEAKSIKVSYRSAEEYFQFFLENQLPPTKDHHSSMFQDIQAGRKTEIDSLNGAISEYGAQLGIPTPYNTILTHLIKAKEQFNTLEK